MRKVFSSNIPVKLPVDPWQKVRGEQQAVLAKVDKIVAPLIAHIESVSEPDRVAFVHGFLSHVIIQSIVAANESRPFDHANELAAAIRLERMSIIGYGTGELMSRNTPAAEMILHEASPVYAQSELDFSGASENTASPG